MFVERLFARGPKRRTVSRLFVRISLPHDAGIAGLRSGAQERGEQNNRRGAPHVLPSTQSTLRLFGRKHCEVE